MTGAVDAEYLQHLEGLRSDNAKAKANRSGRVVPAHPNDPTAPSFPVPDVSTPTKQHHNTMPNGIQPSRFVVIQDEDASCSGPMSGADAAGSGSGVGLAPSFLPSSESPTDSLLGLGNSQPNGIH